MFIKNIISALAFCSVVSVSASQSEISDHKELRISEYHNTLEKLNHIKSKIKEISYEYQGRLDNRPEVRNLLAPLVRELVLLNPTSTKEQELKNLQGAWYQIWSDDYEPDRPGTQKDSSQIYQVVTDKGYFYNLAEVLVDGKTTFTGILRGEYKQGNSGLNIEFVRTGIRTGGLPDDLTVQQFIQGVEEGSIDYIENKDAVFPRGPIGQKGLLINIYLDDTFRVAIGSNNTDGTFDLYVLEKVDTRKAP